MVKRAVKKFGTQCIIGALDYKTIEGITKVSINCGNEITNENPIDYAKKLEQLGIGELYFNSIDLDGTMKGYDIEILEKLQMKFPFLL